MPSNGYTDEYKELVSTVPHSQPIMLVGDFNAHLAGPGNICIPNSQGVALEELVHRNNLYVGNTTSGPNYTFCSGGVRTIVDCYQSASYLISSLSVLEDHLLNTSDHLAVSIYNY